MLHKPGFDLEVRVLPDPVSWLGTPSLGKKIHGARRLARSALAPYLQGVQDLSLAVRYLPGDLHHLLEQVGGLAVLPNLLFEATREDLLESMHSGGLKQALVVCHPPTSNNDFVLRTCEGHSQLHPAVSLSSPDEVSSLTNWVHRGAKALRIPVPWPELLNSSLVKECEQFSLPVLIPPHSDLKVWEPLIRASQEVSFVVMQMNSRLPLVAFEMGARLENLHVATANQPPELIAEACQRLGDHRVHFSSGWPIGGRNIEISLERLILTHGNGWINEATLDKVLYQNTLDLLGD